MSPNNNTPFLKIFFASFIGLTILVGLLNYLVDPLNIHKPLGNSSFNTVKPKLHKYTRITKPVAIEKNSA